MGFPVQMYSAAFARSPGTLRVLCGYSPGVPYGCYPGTQGYSGYSHSPRQSRSRPWRRGRGRRATTAVRRHWPGRRRPVVHRPIVQVLPGCTRTRAHTRTHAHTHTRTRTRTRICTHTRTRTQPCLQMHIPITHIHTRTHSHTPALRAAAAVSERSACRTCAASPAHGTITARLWCLLRATNIDVYICMHAGSTERERRHFTCTYEDGLEDDAAGRRLGSAAEANPTKSEKSRQGFRRGIIFGTGPASLRLMSAPGGGESRPYTPRPDWSPDDRCAARSW